MPTTRRKTENPPEPIIMHGAKLPASMVYKVGVIHAATRKTKRQLHIEAYQLLLAKYEREGILEPTAAELAERTLTGDGGNA